MQPLTGHWWCRQQRHGTRRRGIKYQRVVACHLRV